MPNFGLKDFSLPWKGRVPSTGSTNGVNAYTALTSDFTQPAVGAAGIANVGASSWAAVGQVLFLAGGGGYYQVSAKPTATSITLLNLGYPGNATAGTPIPAPSQLSPAGLQGVSVGIGFGTNYQGGIASATSYGIGPGGFSSDFSTVSSFLVLQETTLSSFAASTAVAPGMGQELTFNLRRSSDNGATWSNIGDPLVITTGLKSDSATFSAVTINAFDLIAVEFSLNTGSMTTSISASAA